MVSSESRACSSLLTWRLADNPPGGIKPMQNNAGIFCSTSCRISDKRLPAAQIFHFIARRVEQLLQHQQRDGVAFVVGGPGQDADFVDTNCAVSLTVLADSIGQWRWVGGWKADSFDDLTRGLVNELLFVIRQDAQPAVPFGVMQGGDEHFVEDVLDRMGPQLFFDDRLGFV